jgi:NitT/TauT family transport system ATP-binding protein
LLDDCDVVPCPAWSHVSSVELRSIERDFPATGPVVSKLDLKISEGEFVAFLGPSGCGKSTLLRLIAGLDEPDRGSIEIDPNARKFFRGFVFQESHLLPWRDVLGNVKLPLELMKQPREVAEQKAREALAKVGLTDALAKYPAQLSGGMKMRVSVARALVSEPRLLLLDEPFAALDENTRHRLQEDLRTLWINSGLTVIFVTHSVSEAVYLADRAIVFSKRPARIVLDHKLDLPRSRPSEIRSTLPFIKEIEAIGHAFREGEKA